MRLNPILVALTLGIIALWVLIFASYAHADNAIFMNIKTATFALTKQVKQADGTLKTVTVGRFPSWFEAMKAMRTLPPGQYRITVPSPYVTLIPCTLPPTPAGSSAICLDSIDNRLYTVQP